MGESSRDKKRKQYICAGIWAVRGLESLLLNTDMQCSILHRARRLTETALELRTSYLPPLLFIDKYQELPKGFPNFFISEDFWDENLFQGNDSIRGTLNDFL